MNPVGKKIERDLDTQVYGIIFDRFGAIESRKVDREIWLAQVLHFNFDIIASQLSREYANEEK